MLGYSEYYRDRWSERELVRDFPADEVLIDGLHAMQMHFEQTIAFVRKAFQTGEVEMQGTAITQCLPPLPLFSPNNEREQSKQRVLNKLCAYFDKFYDIYNFVEGPITVNIYENGI